MTNKRHHFSLTPEWPTGIPNHCEHCGNNYDILFALEVGPCRKGRLLRKFAPWMTIVMFILMALTKFSFLDFGGGGAPMAFVAAIILPSVLIWILGGLLPTKLRLYCYKCNRSEYFNVA